METKFEIIIVDDDVDLASNLSDILSSEGYGTRVACDGKTAVALCRKKTFDLAIVDIKLPDMSGLELIRELVKLSPATEYIIITGYASLETATEAVSQQKTVAYETKPVDIERLITLIKQVVERRQVEEELRKSEDRYRATFEHTGTTMILVQEDATVSMVNKQGLALFGYSREEIEGKRKWVEFVHPEDLAQMMEYHRLRRKEGGEAPKQYEARLFNRAGDILDMIVSVDMIPGTKQSIVSLLDITERKQAEEEQARLRQQAQLASRLASAGEMSSGIAHEINNPLTSVIGYSQLLLERDIPEDIGEDVRIIADGAQRVADIVKRLLTFARQYEPVKSSNDINQIIEVTLELRGYELKTGNIEVITRLDPELPWVICDAGQLQQVFMNITINAEIEMRKAHDKGRLVIKTERIDDSIRISFTDDGPGITKEDLSRIFDPFFTTREVGDGTGLGLSISHGIITDHGGQIYAESESGKGTTFFVELPIITEQELPQAIEEAGEEGVKKALPARILVVDDEPSILTYLDKLLTAQGHQVETADNPVYGLNKIKENRYRLILLDIKMPGMSGIELYHSIGEISPSLTRRVVFITGDMMSADTKRFITESKVPYITKPFDTRKLKKELNRILTEGK